jgi:hypothetical protein
VVTQPDTGEGRVVVSTRYRISPSEGPSFLESASIALSAVMAQPGSLTGRIGRATDDPQLWLLTCEWESVGAYRRALGAYEVKMHAIPVMYRAIDEPTAFEVLRAVDPAGVSNGPTRRAADADEVGVGRASGPDVRTDLA